MLNLKALSVRQPWAWALIHAGKDCENRSAFALQHMNFRGVHRLAIHAAKGMTRCEYEDAFDFMRDTFDFVPPAPRDLIRGAIIGSVAFLDIVHKSPSRWFFGPRAIRVHDAQACEPIPCVGALGLFAWKPSGELVAPAKWMLPINAEREQAQDFGLI